MAGLSRRSLTLGALTSLVACACQRRSEAAPSPGGAPVPGPEAHGAGPDAGSAQGGTGGTRLLEWAFEGAVSTRTVMLIPNGASSGRYPVLVALHGRGEARKPPEEGALGWARDYALLRALDRVAAPPLAPADFEGYVETKRLSDLNGGLSTAPFGGLIVACPYVPDIKLEDDRALREFAVFVVSTLLPRVRRETPALATSAATGIDGVSLGGTVALAVGLGAPSEFGAVGTLQPALDIHDTDRWTRRALEARGARPSLALRLLTSDGDYFRDAVRATSAAWRAAAITHDFEEVVGPHDYPFNRGPGAIEMLLWHDRVLRRAG